jgi:hypothetical protein
VIYLFNLNNYIGGGEVYVIAFAEYLKSNSIAYNLICSNDSFISVKAEEKKLNYLIWPSKQLSINYASKSQKVSFEIFFKNLILKSSDIILACNMRELYTSIHFFRKFYFQIRTIILHPEEYKYLASGSIYKSKYYNRNRFLLKLLDSHNLVIYPNKNARNVSLNCDEDYLNIFPFPVAYSNYDTLPSNLHSDMVKIIIISRFVSFKISTILSLIKTVYNNSNYELTIIGYGPWKFLLKIYLYIYNTNRIITINKLQPEELRNYILKSNIGVAQGTSILQIIKFNRPVIIAPYSKWYNFLFESVKSPGIFGLENKINWGDIYWNLENEKYTFDFLITKVLKDYNKYVNCTKVIRDQLDEKIIYNNLYKYISTYTDFIVPDNFIIPAPPFFKLLFRRIKSIF